MGEAADRPSRPLWAALALSLIALALVITDAGLYLGNSLYAGDRWFPTKARILHLPSSALPFWTLGQAVARNQLDLSTWHGFHQVVHLPPLRTREVRFSLRLAANGWAALVLEKPSTGRYEGVVFSASPHFPQVAFEAESSGRFSRRRPWRQTPLEPDRWYRARVTFNPRLLSVELDGQRPVTLPRSTGGPLRVGFRGGARPVQIDDVTVIHGDGQTLNEDFSNRSRALLWFLAALVVLAGLSYAARLRKVTPRRAALAATLLHLILALVVGTLYGMQYFVRSHRYPSEESTVTEALHSGLERRRLPTALRRHLQFIVTTLQYSDDPNLDMDGPDPEYFKAKLRRRYPVKAPPGVRRVLFVGTSQTHGDGVSVEHKTFVALTQRLLNRRRPAGSAPFVCVNAGMPNIAAKGTADYYTKELVRLRPDLAIINLGSNDVEDPVGFEHELSRMARASKAHRVRTVLSLEANAVDCSGPGELSTHKVSRRLAKEHGFGVMDLHGYLSERAGSGFQWWDCVHLSQHGQQQAAELFTRQILRAFKHPASDEAPGVVLSPAGHQSGAASCDERIPLGRCHAYSAAAMEVMGRDFHQGACELTNGRWSGKACPAAGRLGSCDDGADTVTHYYATGKTPYTADSARADCELFGAFR